MEHTLKIEKIIAGGFGLARLPGGPVVMVDQVLAGETVRIREISRKQGYLTGQLVELIEPSPERCQAPCPLYGVCGGCNLQHAAYPAQLRIKQAILQEALERAHVPLADGVLQAPLAAPEHWGYRFRVRVRLDDRGKSCFLRKASSSPVPVKECPVASHAINQTLRELAGRTDLPRSRSVFLELELLCSPADGRVIALLHGDYENTGLWKTPPLNTAAAFLFTQDPTPGTLNAHTGLLLRQDFSDPPYSLRWPPGCFSQINPQQNEVLVATALRFFSDLSGRRILDLYCGMGNFSLPMALAGAHGLGMEHNPVAIRWARKNALAAGIDTFVFQTARVEDGLPELVRCQERFDGVLLDPPRAGLGKLTNALARLEAPRIVYVSCDPVTLARDLHLLAQAGYRLRRLTPVDMFPQTHHIESVALLEKN